MTIDNESIIYNNIRTLHFIILTPKIKLKERVLKEDNIEEVAVENYKVYKKSQVEIKEKNDKK